jgi:drug/metabolite transporter (DMT)-like permease
VIPIVVLALLASLFYGASDFLGALGARRLTVLKASVVIFLAATAATAAALPVSPWVYSDRALWAGVVAGLFAVIGMVTFYAALAAGPMSLLAPLIALIQTAIPVVVAAATGQELRLLAWIAVGLGLVATTLVSVPAEAVRAGARIERITARGGLLALVSGTTLGLSVVALDAAPAASGVFPAFLDIGVGLAVLLPLLAVPRLRNGDGWLGGGQEEPRMSDAAGAGPWAMSAVGGVLLGVGNILLVVSLHAGNLAIVAVLVGLYPLATVVLARLVLKERLSLVQGAGVALAVAAAVMLGLS